MNQCHVNDRHAENGSLWSEYIIARIVGQSIFSNTQKKLGFISRFGLFPAAGEMCV